MTFPEDEKPVPGDAESPEPPAAQPEETPAAEMPAPEGPIPPFPVEADALPEFDFPRMEEDLAAFHRELDEIRFTPTVRASADETTASTANAPRRRRRSKQLVERLEAGELGERLEVLAYRAAPTFDFFVFAFLSGCLLGLGYILDAPAILLVGVLVAPILAPWIGAALATATGEIRFLGQTLGGFFSALVMVFVVGLLAGLSSRIFQPLTSSQAFLHARLWWPDLLLLVAGTVILVIAFIQSENKPALASLMVAYELFLPASAAGFGIGSGVEGLWPEAGLVFLIHLALSLMVSLMVFFYMGFRPLEARGYALAGGMVIVSLVVVAGFAGLGSLLNAQISQPAATPSALPVNTSTPVPLPVPRETPLPTWTVAPAPVKSPTATQALPPTPTTAAAVASPTLLPTPVYGKVQSMGDGAVIRTAPGAAAITTIQNGYLVEILGDAPQVVDGATWVHVIVKTPSRDIDGWMLLNLISTSTPSGSP